jgi:hypothetical protein
MWEHCYVISFVTNVGTLLCNAFCNKCGYTVKCYVMPFVTNVGTLLSVM